MESYVLWQAGLRGPTIAVLNNRGNPPTLTERETSTKVHGPIPMRDGDEAYPLRTIERLYPMPTPGISDEKVEKIRAIATDDRADPAMRVVAERKLSVIHAESKGYTGDECGTCHGLTMVRNGTCLKCDTCGSTTGCS